MGQVPVFMTMKRYFGMDLVSSGVMSGSSVICKLWLGAFLPRDMKPFITVRMPGAFESASAV